MNKQERIGIDQREERERIEKEQQISRDERLIAAFERIADATEYQAKVAGGLRLEPFVPKAQQ